MKKRSREINVFSVSALDLFASALGAFIVISLIFMVSFGAQPSDADQPPASDAALRLEQVAADLERCRSDAESAAVLTGRLGRANADLESCQRLLERTFVLVVASWSSTDDVDLHVVDPAGREFYFRRKRIPGSPAALEEDNIQGPGNEVWLHPLAESGRYRLCYKLYTKRSAGPVAVRGSVLWQEGRLGIPDVELRRTGEVRVAAEVRVDDRGRVTIDRGRSGQLLAGERCG